MEAVGFPPLSLNSFMWYLYLHVVFVFEKVRLLLVAIVDEELIPAAKSSSSISSLLMMIYSSSSHNYWQQCIQTTGGGGLLRQCRPAVIRTFMVKWLIQLIIRLSSQVFVKNSTIETVFSSTMPSIKRVRFLVSVER